MNINFEKVVKSAEFLNPRKGFTRDRQTIEFRRDPLTGRWCRINVERARRGTSLGAEGVEEDFKVLIEASRDTCYFCERNLEKSTPKFTPDISREGRIRRRSVVVFPNLFPFGEHHAICVISKAHYLELCDISRDMWLNSLLSCIDFLKRIHEKDRRIRYPIVGFNYMPPAGASIFHPHLQILMDWKASSALSELMGKSLRYHEENKSCFWSDLLESEEAIGERHIGNTGVFSWISSFAPSGNNEVVGVMRQPASCITEMDRRSVGDLADGLSKVLKGLWLDRGVRSINLSVYSGPLGDGVDECFRLHVKIFSRPTFKSHCVNDRGFMETLHFETVVQTSPEDTARDLRKYFQ
ncbi:MAG: hypothetical protein ACE5GD_05780 [Candidatus Geothermarchaeales archaeon]